jgi:NAD+ kinase
MGREFNKIVILGRRDDKRVAGPLAQLVEHLTKAGIEVRDDTQVEGADLAIAIGGDGTMLYAGSRVRDHDIPLLGINRGRLGFLADVLPDEMLASVDLILQGQYFVEERLLL